MESQRSEHFRKPIKRHTNYGMQSRQLKPVPNTEPLELDSFNSSLRDIELGFRTVYAEDLPHMAALLDEDVARNYGLDLAIATRGILAVYTRHAGDIDSFIPKD